MERIGWRLKKKHFPPAALTRSILHGEDWKLSTMQYLSSWTLLTWPVPSTEGSNARYFKFIYIYIYIYTYFNNLWHLLILIIIIIFFQVFEFRRSPNTLKLVDNSVWIIVPDADCTGFLNGLIQMLEVQDEGWSGHWTQAIPQADVRLATWFEDIQAEFRAPWKSLWLIRSIRMSSVALSQFVK